MRPSLMLLTVLALSAIGCRQINAPPADRSGSDLELAVTERPAEALHSRSGRTKSAARFEIRFLQDMIDHHGMAVEMAMLCEGRVVHSELQQLCDRIRTSQQQEIVNMQSWLAGWYGLSHEPQMSAADQRMLEHLAGLHGAAFETAFMGMMIEHHGAAIEMARKALRRGYHRELVELARAIVATQSTEIRTMREWLCSWYQRCNEHRHHRG